MHITSATIDSRNSYRSTFPKGILAAASVEPRPVLILNTRYSILLLQPLRQQIALHEIIERFAPYDQLRFPIRHDTTAGFMKRL